MVAKNDITGDVIASRQSNQNYDANYDNIFPEKEYILDTPIGKFKKCSKRCWIEYNNKLNVVECTNSKCDNYGEQDEFK